LLTWAGYLWLPEAFLWMPERHLRILDYYLRMPERYLGKRSDERLDRIVVELFRTKSDREEYRLVLGEPDEIVQLDDGEEWIYRGYRIAVMITFDVQTGSAVDIAVLKRSKELASGSSRSSPARSNNFNDNRDHSTMMIQLSYLGNDWLGSGLGSIREWAKE